MVDRTGVTDVVIDRIDGRVRDARQAALDEAKQVLAAVRDRWLDSVNRSNKVSFIEAVFRDFEEALDELE